MKKRLFYLGVMIICLLLFRVSTSAALADETIVTSVATTAAFDGEINASRDFRVIDEFKDEADLGGGQKVYRIYSSPRLVEKTANGKLKLRPKGWNLFNERASSRFVNSTKLGYEYSIDVTGKGGSVKILAGEMTFGKTTQLPLAPKLEQETMDNQNASLFKNVYPGVDVRFVDGGQSRQKNIIIRQAPTGITSNDILTFWENIQLGKNANAYLANGTMIAGDKDITQKGLYIKDNIGNRVDISTAIVSDSSGRLSEFIENPNLYIPKQIVKLDKKTRVLKIGLQIEGKYLLNKERVYPIIVDPTYTGCSEVAGNNMTCTLKNFFLRAKNAGSDTGGTICNPAGNCDAANPANNQRLFLGRYLSGGSYYTRHALLYFDLPQLSSLGTVQSALLHMYYNINGSGTASSASIKAKQLKSAPNPSSIPTGLSSVFSYATARSNILANDSAAVIDTTPGSKWYAWYITNTVKNWYNNPSGYFALVVENADNWPSGSTPPASWSDRLFIFMSKEYSTNSSPYIQITTADPIKPDLTDNGSTFSPTSVQVGQQVAITFKVKNTQSTAVNQNSVLKYYLNPVGSCSNKTTYLGSVTVPTMSANGTYFTVVNYTPTNAGSYCIQFDIDANNNVDESNETNNGFYISTLTVNAAAIPDLMFSGTPTTNPTSPVIGGQTTINAIVKNNGTATANSTLITYYLDGSNVGTQSVPTLPAGNSSSVITKTISIPKSTSIGSHDIQLKISSVTGETNTGNNTTDIYPNFVSGFDFSPLSLSITNTSVHYSGNGDGLQLSAQIKNNGSISASNILYQLKFKNTSYYLSGLSPATLSLNAGETKTVSLYGTIPDGMPSANYNVDIILDSNSDFTESNEGNNTLSSSNSVPIQLYFYDGGGGGAAPVNNIPPAVTVALGLKEGGVIKIADKANYTKSSSITADKNNGSSMGDPVNGRNGAFEFEQTDFKLAGRGVPVVITRTYNSKIAERNARFGSGWSHSYHMYYYQDPDTKEVQIYLGGALVSYFTTPDSGATFVAERGDYNTLYNEGDYIVYKTIKGIKYYFSNKLIANIGMIDHITDTNNNITQFNYVTVRGVELISTITDPSGRTINFVYPASDTDPHWDKVVEIRENLTGVSKLIAGYTYDANNNLIQAHQESAYSGEAVKNVDHYFTYDASGRMTSYTDPRETILYNEYDASGRVVKQYEKNPRLGASDKRLVYEFTYTDSADPGVAGSAHCTLVKNYRDASNHYDEYACFNSDELKIYSQKGVNIEHWIYNAQGMPTQYTNGNGNVYNYEYDAKRRMTKEIPPDANGWHTEKALSYEDNFNRLTQETITAVKIGSPTVTQIKKYAINAVNGNVTSIEDPMGFVESFTYDAYGNVWTRTDKNGKISTFAYDIGGNYQTQQSIIVQDVDGASQDVVKKFEYDVYGNIKKHTDPRGLVYLYEHDTRDNLRKETNAVSGVKTYTYDKEGHRLTATDELGRVTTYTYDKDINASLLKIEKQSADGPVISERQYNWLGNLEKEIDPMGNEVNYTHNSANRVSKKQMPYNAIDYTYDGVGNVVSEVNFLGQKTDYGYDARGNQISIKRYLTDAEFVAQIKEFDGLSRVVKTKDGNNGETRYQYDNNNRLVKIINSIGAETSYKYDNNGNKIEEIDPLNHSAYHQYDALNRPIKMTNALGKETKFYYDANDNLTKIIDRQDNNGANNNHVTEFIYDNLNRKTQEKDAYGAVVKFDYDAVGNLTVKTDQLNRVWTYGYDDLSRLTSEKDPADYVTAHTYDKVGNTLSTTHADGKKTTFIYDNANRLTQIKDVLGNSRYYQYDVVGNKTKETDKLGRETKFVYDKLNRLTQETNAQNTVVNYTYDKNSSRLTENVAGKIKTFVYDADNRVTSVDSPGEIKESFTYDLIGNATAKTDGNNQAINYTYDASNRVTQKSLPEGQTVIYTYDNWNNLTSVKGDNNDAIYVYNLNNQQTSETQVLPGLAQNFNVTRVYNAARQLTSLTDAKGVTINYEYDNRGLLSKVKNGTENLASYSYTSFNKPQALIYGNGLTTNYEYDELHRTKEIEILNGAVSLWKHEYNYNAENNRTQLTENSARVITYGYDNLDQITSVKYPDTSGSGEIKFDYDTWGNRQSLTSQLGVTNYAYAANSDELQNYKINNRLQVNLQYNGNGSLTQEIYQRLGKNIRAVDYSWDSQNRLRQIAYQYTGLPSYLSTLPNNTMQFVYDDFGNRVKKTVNGKPTYYLNDGLRVLNEIDQAGAVDKTIIYGLEQVAEIKKDGIIQFIHSDVLGSTILVTDQTGAVKQKYEYDVFGSIIGKDGLSETNYLFTNQEYDSESELYYYNARYYNPAIGRFISRDPMPGRDGDVISRNSYVYVKNNPLKYVDPDGMDPKKKQNTEYVDNRSKLEKVFDYIFGVETAYAPGPETVFAPSGSNGTLWTPGGPATTVGQFTDAADISALFGENLDGTNASLSDKAWAIGGLAIPVISGSGVKNIVKEGVAEILYHGTTKNRAINILKEGFNTVDDVFASKELGTAIRFAEDKTAEVAAKASAIVRVNMPKTLFESLKSTGDIIEQAIDPFGGGMSETIFSPSAIKQLNNLKDVAGSGVEYLIKKVW